MGDVGHSAVDWNVVDIPSILRRVVRSYDTDGNEIPDDGEWHRRVSESDFVIAEFLAENGLVASAVSIQRHPELILKFSDLTSEGKAFVKSGELDRWRDSLDRGKREDPITDTRLKRRFEKFKSNGG